MAWASVLAQTPSYRTHCIPSALNGDGVPTIKGKSLYVISAVSLLGIGTNFDVQMILTCYWSHLNKKNKDLHDLDLDTEDIVWKHIQWDLEAWFSGVHPNTDALGNAWPPGCEESTLQGTPLAYGYFAVPWILKRRLGILCPCVGIGTLGQGW